VDGIFYDWIASYTIVKNLFLSFLVFSLVFGQVFGYLPANTAFATPAGQETKEIYDVVALVVHKDIMDDDTVYQGIIEEDYFSYLAGYDTMAHRVMRYAEDIQIDSPGTVAKILEYDPERDTLLDVIAALEGLYKNGLDSYESRLRGVVLVGQIPLPVVNKNGNRFISMYPLTDFDEKAYIFNYDNQSFEQATQSTFPQPEIWHGVMREPQLDDKDEISEVERNKLALFFDKNHLYHSGVAEFSDFEEKIFYGDMIHEEENVNEDMFMNYQRFLKNQEDLAYFRYNKKWAGSLAADVNQELEDQGLIGEEGEGLIAIDTSSFKDQKDLLMKFVIDTYHSSYPETLSRYSGVASDNVEYTGRYDPNGQMATIPGYIAMKDVLTQAYLRMANDAVEMKVNEIVDEMDTTLKIAPTVQFNVSRYESGVYLENVSSGTFVNHGGNGHINGISIDDITSPKQCAPFLGTMYDSDTSSEFSTLTRSVSYDNVMTGVTKYTLGVNGFSLSPELALELTDGEYDYGMLVGTNEEYGYPALYGDGPLEKAGVQEGDVILEMQPTYSSYLTATTGQNTNSCDTLLGLLEYGFDLNPTEVLPAFVPGESVRITSPDDLDDAVQDVWDDIHNTDKGGQDKNDEYCTNSTVGIKYYDASKGEVTSIDGIRAHYYGSPGRYLVPMYSMMRKSDVYSGANVYGGLVGNNGLAGCFFSSTVLHDDRCFSRYATYPIIDVAGSYEPYYEYGVLMDEVNAGAGNVKKELEGYNITTSPETTEPRSLTFYPNKKGQEVLDENPSYHNSKDKIFYEYQFPVGERTIYDDDGDGPIHKIHNEQFQKPRGREFTEIDEIYLDACYDYLPTYPILGHREGVKSYEGEKVGVGFLNLAGLDSALYNLYIGMSGNRNDHVPYGGVPHLSLPDTFSTEYDDLTETPHGTNNIRVKSSNDFPLAYTGNSLKSFGYLAEHFGLYDGIDNDGDGVIDYKNIDTDDDGKYDSFIVDTEEYHPRYGFDPKDLNQFGRKILSKNLNWRPPVAIGQPQGQNRYPLPYESFFAGGNATQCKNYDKTKEECWFAGHVVTIAPKNAVEIPSIITHNEPTNYTIAKQWEAKIAHSLPIDDPRYVAFMDSRGDVQKIKYPNLYESGSYHQFDSDLKTFTGSVLKIGDSYLLDKENGSQAKYIYNSLKRVTIDSEEEVFVNKDPVTKMMRSADGEMLRDALHWNGLSIDDKHEYILKYYLDEGRDPFIGTVDGGYETAYLVFEGGSGNKGDFIDMKFNKEPLTEQEFTYELLGGPYEGIVGEGYGKDGYPLDSEADPDFIPLKEFFDELKRFGSDLKKFVKDFENISAAEPCCRIGDDEEEDKEASGTPITYIAVNPSKEIALSGGDYIDIEIAATGDKEYLHSITPSIELIISQDSAAPIFEIRESDELKVLENGFADYRVFATDLFGSAEVRAVISIPGYEDFVSGPVNLSVSPNSIDIRSDIDDFEVGTDEEILLKAYMLREGELDPTVSGRVVFTPSHSGMVEFVGGNTAVIKRGIASVTVRPLKKAGIVSMKAGVLGDDSFANGLKEIFVTPGDPAQIEILPDSTVLIGNGQSKAGLIIRVLDEFGNLVSHDFSKVSVFVFGNATLNVEDDLDLTMPGIQLFTELGLARTTLYSQEETGSVNVYAIVTEIETENELIASLADGAESLDLSGILGASRTFEVLGDARLQLFAEDLDINADGVSKTEITATLTDASGKRLTGYNGDVTFQVSDPAYLELRGAVPHAMFAGEASLVVSSTTKAGEALIVASAPGFAEGEIVITTLPSAPVELVLTSEQDSLLTTSVTGTILRAEMFDKYGNLATTSTKPLKFLERVADGQDPMIEIVEKDAYATNGVGFATVKATGKSGFAQMGVMVAEAGSIVVNPGKLKLEVEKRMDDLSYKSIAPNALYVNLLGSPFFDNGINDLASSFIYSSEPVAKSTSKTQALLTTTASSEQHARSVFVDGYGHAEILDEGIDARVVTGRDMTKVKFGDVGEMFVVLKDGLNIEVVEDMREVLAEGDEGIYVEPILGDFDEVEFVVAEDSSKVSLMKGDDVLMSVNRKGHVRIVGEGVEIRMPGAEDPVMKNYYSYVIGYQGEAVGHIMFVQDVAGGVSVLRMDNSSTSFVPGVYLRSNSADDGYSRYSTEFEKGAYIVNKERGLDPIMSPGFGYASVEDAAVNEGVGLRGDNKNMLLFTGGNTAGDSNMPYASEVGVLLGDPTVRLDTSHSEASGFDKYIGKHLFSGDAAISDIEYFDYNGDGYDDLLLLYESGEIRLMENELSTQRFKDRGLLLYIPNGILSIAKLDIDNDDMDDLLIATEDSCIEGEQCYYLYKNNGGQFVRENLELSGFDESDRIYDLQTYDMNNDDYPDVVMSDSSGNVYIFWNKGGELDDLGQFVGNFGLKVDDIELISEIYLQYPGLDVYGVTGNGATTISYPTPPPGNSLSEDSVGEIYGGYPMIGHQFVNALADDYFQGGSSKKIIDLNGGSIALGDIIEYRIRLSNAALGQISGLVVSDFMPSSQVIIEDSLECSSGACSWAPSDSSLRSRVIKGVSVASAGVTTIKYRAEIVATPAVNFAVGHYEDVEDGYLDIMVSPEENQDGEIVYYDSKDSLDGSGHVAYSRRGDPISRPIAGSEMIDDLVGAMSELDTDDFGLSFPDGYENVKDYLNSFSDGEGTSPEDCDDEKGECPPEGVDVSHSQPTPKKEVEALTEEIDKDEDGDGIPDFLQSWGGFVDEVDAAMDNIESGIEEGIAMTRCSGQGCLPIPYNEALLVPTSSTPGIAAIAWGIPGIPPVLPFYPSDSPSTGRFYISPTTTLGIGFGICTGASPKSGQCFVSALPMNMLGGGVCESIGESLTDAVAGAQDFVSSSNGETTLMADGQEADSDTFTHSETYGDKDSPLGFQDKVNIKVPGFPSVFTNWFDSQIEEIFNKLLDLPDFYLILPDVKSLANETAYTVGRAGEINNPQEFLMWVNQMPLVQIRGEEVQVKIPALSKDEIDKYEKQWEVWKKDLERQWEDTKEYWKCDLDTENKTICDAVEFKLDDVIRDIEELLDTLEFYKNLPKKILEIKTAEQKYARQIICYLDAVMEFTSGYMNKQSRSIASWMRAVNDVVAMIKSWKPVMDVMVEYQESCDDCKTDRFSNISALLQLFLQIPEPPIVEIPKWPDFVFDFSKLQLGAEIIWPDIIFKPQYIELPDIPPVVIPKIMPTLTVEIDSFIPEIPKLPIAFDYNLPDLPPLPIPDLPDLPRAPKIPKIPEPVVKLAVNLKKIFKIICLVQKAIVPVPEATATVAGLKTEIEVLTNPGINAVLPFTVGLGMQMPGIEYDAPSEFSFTVKSKFGVDTNVIYQVVYDWAQEWNKIVEKYVQKINKITTRKLDLDIDKYLKEEHGVTPNWELDTGEVKKGFQKKESNSMMYFVAENDYFDDRHPLYDRPLEELEYVDVSQFEGASYMSGIAQFRNELLAYARDMDSLDADTYIASNGGVDVGLLATNDSVLPAGGAGDAAPGEEIVKFSFDEEYDELLAFEAPGIGDFNPADNQAESPTPAGMHVFTENGQTENILYYTEELGGESHVIYMDVDNDGDQDIVYSTGGDLYLKKNYDEDPNELDIVTGLLGVDGVDEYGQGQILSVQNLDRVSESSESVSVTFDLVKNPDVIGYEMLVYPSLIDLDNNETSDAYRYLIVEDADEVEIDEDSDFEVLELDGASAPDLKLEIPDGNYYSVVYPLTENGRRGFASMQAPVAPQVCGDDDAPLPALSNTEIYVPVTQPAILDASASFDAGGRIKEYYLDSDTSKDSDGDGDPANDKDPSLWSYEDPTVGSKFILGPFYEVGDVEMALNILDLANNRSTQFVTIHVFVPGITLDPVVADSSFVTGDTDPTAENMRFALMRERFKYRLVDGQLAMVKTEDKIATGASDEFGHYFTLGDGSYEISDFDLSDILFVYDAEGNVVAEIDLDSGNFWTEDGYTYEVHTAQPPVEGTYITIEDPNGNEMGTIYHVSEGASDVEVHNEVEFDTENVEGEYGTHVSDMDADDEFEFRQYPPNDPNYPNGVYLYYINESKHMAAIDTHGNVLVLDDRLTVDKKENEYQYEPFVYEIFFEEDKIAEVYVSPTGMFEEAQIVGPDDVPYDYPNGVTPQYLYDEQELDPHVGNPTSSPTPIFTDLDGELLDHAMNLYNQGLIDGDYTFGPDDLTSRGEFIKMLIGMLCIVPRPEAYDEPAVFTDMPYTDPLPEYYEFAKEGALLGLVEGYADGSFDSGKTIVISEAAKIIVEGLDLQGVIDTSGVDFDDYSVGWYDRYFDVALDITPYAEAGVVLKNSYIITEEEAANPDKELTRAELVELAYRVLEAYNCIELDKDDNGLGDYCEAKYGINDPDADPDEDGLVNKDECFYGTDPFDYDTDDGGVGDGDEVLYGTHPLADVDDQNDTDGDGLLDIEEIKVYLTDPNDPDTDDGGVYDGNEVANQTDPLDGDDDYGEAEETGQLYEAEPGVYIVPGACTTCPCISTFEYQADLREGDVLYTIILNQDETNVYARSNKETVK
jgi:uncharacterized repeat protein (TIGR01451 family)